MNRRGYTIFELLIVISILGAIAAAVVIIVPGAIDNTNRTAALSKARLVDAARNLYASDVPDESEWTPLETSGRLNLLITKSYLAGALTDYSALAGSYSLALNGSIRSKTIVNKADVQISP